MAIFNPKTNREQITGLTHDSTWNDVDVSSNISASATGIALRVVNTDASNSRDYGVRKNGSTDTYTFTMSTNLSTVVFVGVDGSGIFELNSSNANLEYYIVGYFEDFVFFDNWSTFSGPTNQEWGDVDVTSELGADAGNVNCVLTIIASEIDLKENNHGYGIRANGATDDFFEISFASHYLGFAVELDANDVFEIFGDTSNYMVGYLVNGTDGYVGITYNDINSGNSFSTNAWTDYDLSSLVGSNANSALIYTQATTGNIADTRENGSSNTETTIRVTSHTVGLDSSKLIEYYTESASADYWVMGYFQDSTPAPAVEERTRRHIFRR